MALHPLRILFFFKVGELEFLLDYFYPHCILGHGDDLFRLCVILLGRDPGADPVGLD